MNVTAIPIRHFFAKCRVLLGRTRALLLGVCLLALFWFCRCRTTTFMGHINFFFKTFFVLILLFARLRIFSLGQRCIALNRVKSNQIKTKQNSVPHKCACLTASNSERNEGKTHSPSQATLGRTQERFCLDLQCCQRVAMKKKSKFNEKCHFSLHAL